MSEANQASPQGAAAQDGPLVVVGCDFSEYSEKAIAEAGRWAGKEGGRLLVVFCLDDDLPPILHGDARESALEQHRETALARLHNLAARLVKDVPYEVMVVDGPARRQLVRVVKSEGAALLVLASRGHSLVTELLLGSTAEAAVRHSPCSVLLLR